jgi:hypothetical protein
MKKTFNEVLAELDEMIKADFIKFHEDLKKLSIREKMDQVFENSENITNLADESEYEPIHLEDDKRYNYKDESTITSGKNNS